MSILTLRPLPLPSTGYQIDVAELRFRSVENGRVHALR